MDGLLRHLGGLWVRPIEGETGGQTEFGFLATEIHANRNGVVHGGMLMTFIDRAFGQTARDAGQALRGATINLNVSFLAPMQLGSFATLRPQVSRVTGRMAFVEGTVLCDGTALATAQGVWRISRSSG
ncbi:MAG: PaaI family thioesterase [Rhodobacteraceae bacterium]|nr:PaaI family thioesterase [Paracoccaceae bacterium]